MKVLYSYLFTLLFLPLAAYGQTVFSIKNSRCLGGSKNEDAGSSHWGTICQQSNGDIMIAAFTESNDGDVSSSFDLGDIWIVDLTENGSIQWQKCYGTMNGTEVPFCIKETKDKGFIICGYSNSQDIAGYRGSTDALVLKIDSIGTVEWMRCYGGSKRDEAHSIIQTTDGGYAIAGLSKSNDGDVIGNHPTYDDFGNILEYTDMWVVKLDGNGTIKWQYCAGGGGGEIGNSIVETNNGLLLIAGGASSIDEGFNNSGLGDGYIVKLTSDGKLVWKKCYGGLYTDEISNMIPATDGGHLFCGYKDYGGTSLTEADGWVAKIDTNGVLLWDKTFGGSLRDKFSSVVSSSDGGYGLIGTTSSNNGTVANNHGKQDFWVSKISISGELEGSNCFGGSDVDEGAGVVQTSDGGYAVNGRTFSNDGDVSGNHSVLPSKIDHWFVKLKPATKSVEEGSSKTGFAYAYPNPTTDEVKFFVANSELVNGVQFYSMLGEVLYPQYVLSDNVLTADLRGLPTGSYVARISYQGEDNVIRTQTQKFIYYSK